MYPPCQAVQQHKLWQWVDSSTGSPEAIAQTIETLKQEDGSFHMDGASWTNDLSWVSGYENVLEPMNQLSVAFHKKYDAALQRDPATTRQPDYLESLLYVLLLETSCFRYWGQGAWTDYAQALYQRGLAALGES